LHSPLFYIKDNTCTIWRRKRG